MITEHGYYLILILLVVVVCILQWVTAVCVHPHSGHIISGSKITVTTVRVWDADTGECVRTLEGHTYVSIRADDH